MEVCCGTYSYCAGSPGNLPVNHLAWDDALGCIAANGFAHVYVGRDSLGFTIGDPAVAAEELAEARASAESMGLVLHATLMGASLETAGGGEADYRCILEHCSALGIRWVLDFGPPTPDSHGQYISMMQSVAPYAATLGLGISMKPHGMCLSNADLLDVAIEVGHPAFGISLVSAQATPHRNLIDRDASVRWPHHASTTHHNSIYSQGCI